MPVKELVDQLASQDPATRCRAIAGLRKLASEEAAGALVLVLGDTDPDVRGRAAKALAELGSVAVRPVLDYLKNWDGPLDPVIPQLIGQLHTHEALDLLTRHLDDRSPEVRAAIAHALGHLGTSQAIAGLLELLRDLATEVRIAAAHSLGILRDESAVNALLDEMEDDDPAMRIAAARALGFIGSRMATDVLTRVAGEDHSPDVRQAAETAMRRVASRSIEPLIRLLSTGGTTERIQAMTSLLGEGKAAILPVRDLLSHESSTVRSAAAEILGAIADPAGIDALAVATLDSDARVRITAATALGHIKDPRCAELLAPMLDGENPTVAAAAVDGLERLGEYAIDPLIRLLSSDRAETRIRATDVLGRLRHKGSCERLVESLADTTAWVRIVSAQALGEICENRAVLPLIHVLRDRDPVVRAMAAEALGKLCDYRATMPLLARLKDGSALVRTNALRSLGHIGNPVALPYLTSALDDVETDIRIAAIDGLASLRATKAIGRLRAIARAWPVSREPQRVKQAARRALHVLERESRRGEMKETESPGSGSGS